jgi:uncharacterized cofD-like protein
VVLGGGRGLGAVVAALRGEDLDLTVIVRVLDNGPLGSESLGDLRRALETLSEDDVALARAFSRPLTIERLGRHPLGNLMIASLARALGDYGRASAWLGKQLGIAGSVVPATIQPVRREVDAGGSGAPGPTLRFVPVRPESPVEALEAIESAHLAFLAPGSLYTSVLPASAVPQVAGALKKTQASVVWIANLKRDPDDAADMKAIDQLRTLQRHGVRVDAVVYDPAAELPFTEAELVRHRVRAVARELQVSGFDGHDQSRLRAVLRELIGKCPAATTSTAAD